MINLKKKLLDNIFIWVLKFFEQNIVLYAFNPFASATQKLFWLAWYLYLDFQKLIKNQSFGRHFYLVWAANFVSLEWHLDTFEFL
jgi:hypothetical protein